MIQTGLVLGLIAIRRYSTLPRSSKLPHQTQFSVIIMTLFLQREKIVLFWRGYSQRIISPVDRVEKGIIQLWKVYIKQLIKLGVTENLSLWMKVMKVLKHEDTWDLHESLFHVIKQVFFFIIVCTRVMIDFQRPFFFTSKGIVYYTRYVFERSKFVPRFNLAVISIENIPAGSIQWLLVTIKFPLNIN